MVSAGQASSGKATARRTRVVRWALGAAVLTGLALASVDCREATQLTLALSTDFPCIALRETAIVASSTSDEAEQRIPTGFYSAQTSACSADGQIGTLVVTPSDAQRGAVVIVAGVDRKATECTPQNGYLG